MKKTTIFFASISLLFLCFVWINQHQVSGNAKRLVLPSAAPEENEELREEWERQMLADPATGEIPAGISILERQFAANIPNTANPVGKPLGVWESRGPYNVGGRTRAFAIDVNDENNIVAGGVSGGLWASSLGGLLWNRVSPANSHPGVVSVAQDKRAGKTNIWYYLSGEISGTSASGGSAFYLGDGLFKSINGGATWTPVTSTAGGNPNLFTSFYQTGWRVVTDPVAPTTSDVVLMATMGSIYRSANGGNTWTAVLGGSTSAYSYYADLAVTSTGVFYATMSSDGPQGGLWRSTDGINWTNIKPINFPIDYNRVVIGINPNNENEVYFLGSTPGSGNYNHYISSDDWNSLWKYTYISGNGTGANGTWDDRSLNLPHTGTQFDKFASQGGYDLVVKVQPVTNNVFIGGTNIWRSTDGFATDANTAQIGGYKIGTELPFFELYANHHPDQHDFAFLPSNPNVMYSASDGGVIKTMDCNAAQVSWTSCNNGYNTTQFYSVMLDHASPGDSTIIGGLQDNGNFFVNDISTTAPWKMTINGDGSFGAIADHKDYYYLSIQLGKIIKCKIDASGNVTNFKRIDPIGGKDYLFINPLVLDQNNNDIMYVAGGKYLFRNDMLSNIPMNGGWDSIATGWTQFPDSVPSTGKITAVSVSKSPANVVYYGTNTGKLFRIDNANVGTPTPIDVSVAGAGAAYFTSNIAIDPTDANKVIVTFSNYAAYSIFYTEDGGTSWKKVGGNLEVNVAGSGNAPSIRWASILLLPDGTKKYFMGTSVGLFTADSLVLHSAASPGTQWTKEAELGETIVTMIDTRTPDGMVAVATHGSGIWTKNYWDYHVKNENAQNFSYNVSVFPNPASEQANFKLSLPAAAEIEIELLDIKGVLQQKRTYKAVAGEHIYNLDIKSLSSGIYIYNIRCNQTLKSGKLIVNQRQKKRFATQQTSF